MKKKIATFIILFSALIVPAGRAQTSDASLAADIEKQGGSVVRTAYTDANGYYEFDGLCPETYEVRYDPATVPSEFVPTLTGQGTPDSDRIARSLPSRAANNRLVSMQSHKRQLPRRPSVLASLLLASALLGPIQACDRYDEPPVGPSLRVPSLPQARILSATVTQLPFSGRAVNESGQVAGSGPGGHAMLWTAGDGAMAGAAAGGGGSMICAGSDTLSFPAGLP